MGLVFGYLLAKQRSREGLKHQNQVDHLVEFNKEFSDLATSMGMYARSSRETPELKEVSGQFEDQVLAGLKRLQDRMRASDPWMEPKDYEVMERAFKETSDMQRKHMDALHASEGAGPPETFEEVDHWASYRLFDLRRAISDRAEKRAGTHRKWKRHRKRLSD